MPVVKPKPKRTQGKAPVKAKVVAKPKPAAKMDAPTLNGIPLRRKTVWAVDTDSAQFRAARKRDAQALRKNPDGRDSTQFIEGLAEKDMQESWN